MPEAVIVSSVRTPVGRAYKGSLRATRPDDLAALELVRSYKDLSRAERAFRSLKTVDLEIRPIHHRLPDRVRGHVLLCMLAYYVEWHMRQALAPVLFDDHQRDEAAAARTSIVAPAVATL